MKPDIEKIKQESLTKMYEDALETMSDEDVIRMLSELNYLRKQLKSQSDVIARLKQEAYHDPLTGLPNRRYFERELDKAMAYFSRYKRMGALLLIDADSFKSINDSLGHLAGDAILKHIAILLQKHTRNADTVARIGGDEFCIILRETSGEEAFEKAKKIADIIAKTPCTYEGRDIYISVSIGGCSFSEAKDRTDLMNKADSAMYISKNNAVAVA